MKTLRQTLAVLLSLCLGIVPMVGCASSSPTQFLPPQADVTLLGSEEEAVQQLGRQYSSIMALAKSPGKKLYIAVPGADGEAAIISLRFDPDGKPVITSPDGREAFLELGLDGVKPVVRLVGLGSGRVIAEKPITDKAAAKFARGEQITPKDWVEAGIVAMGGAIILWLGVKAVALTAAGLGYLAMAALVVGAVVIASGVVSKVFRTLGWDAQDFVDLFRQSFNDLAVIISGAIRKLQETYNLG